jgi:hypothetical protein
MSSHLHAFLAPGRGRTQHGPPGRDVRPGFLVPAVRSGRSMRNGGDGSLNGSMRSLQCGALIGSGNLKDLRKQR